MSGVTAGTYGSSSNVSQVTIDQYGRVTYAVNVASVSSQWTGLPGSSIYYIPGVSVGSSASATANLQVTGNIYVSNSVTTQNVFATRYYGDGGLLSNIASQSAGGTQTNISSNYTALVTDYYIGVNGTNVTITLPLGTSVVQGKTYVIKDESGQITSNTAYRVTIATSGGNLIDGQTSITMTQSYTALTVFWTGLFWSII